MDFVLTMSQLTMDKLGFMSSIAAKEVNAWHPDPGLAAAAKAYR